MIDNNEILPVLRLGTKIYFVGARVDELPLKDNRLGCIVNLYDGVVQNAYVPVGSLAGFSPYWEDIDSTIESYEEIRDQLKRYLSDEEMVKFYTFFDNIQNGDFLRNKEVILKPEASFMIESMFTESKCAGCSFYENGICNKFKESVPEKGWCKMWIK